MKKKIESKGKRKVRDTNRHIRVGYVIRTALFLLFMICLGLFVTNLSQNREWLKASQSELLLQGKLATLNCRSKFGGIRSFYEVPVSPVSLMSLGDFDFIFFDPSRSGNTDSFSLYVGRTYFDELEEAYAAYIDDPVSRDLSQVSESIEALFRYKMNKIKERLSSLEKEKMRTKELEQNINYLRDEEAKIKRSFALYLALINDKKNAPSCIDLALEERDRKEDTAGTTGGSTGMSTGGGGTTSGGTGSSGTTGGTTGGSTGMSTGGGGTTSGGTSGLRNVTNPNSGAAGSNTGGAGGSGMTGL